ncbi:MAG: AMP-binding protein [Bacteroidales bacterium]|jgi:long-chain acyl-CoA synthetase|nr:AMP-binding protein [Bacteroidales bacterium]
MLINRDKIAVSYQGKAYSYSSLLQHSQCYSNSFAQIKPEAKIIIIAENCPEWIFALYGCWKNRGIAIPVDAMLQPSELAYIINDVSPTAIFTTLSKREIVEKSLADLHITIPILTPKEIDISKIEDLTPEDFIPENKDKTAMINYTSGTTGFAKGVMLSFDNLAYIVHAVCTDIEIFKPGLNTMVLLPAHHILPLMGSIVAPMFAGQTIYIAKSLAAEEIIKTLKEGQIGIIIGVPRLYETLAKGVMSKINEKWITKFIFKLAGLLNCRWLSTKLFKAVHDKFGGHLTYLVSGGAALPVETGRVFKTLGFEVLEGYGMTETAPLISFTHPGKWTVGYSGYPLKGTELEIKDDEVIVKGRNVMQGYYNRPEETAEAVKDGWLYTGDFGYLNRYGLKLTGRKKELIVTSNGKNIDPIEVEKFFYSVSKYVKEIGIFMHENIIQAVIFPDMNAIRSKSVESLPELIREDVLDFNQNVSSYKRIKRYHIVSKELPKTAMGKIQRFRLSELIEDTKNEEEINLKEYSEQYKLLRSFVEHETGMPAKEDAHFEIDMAMDSLSRVALLSYVENTFGIVLTEEQLTELSSLNKLNHYIEENQQNAISNKITDWKDILTAKIADMNLKLPKSGLTSRSLHITFHVVLKSIYRFRTRGVKNIPQEPCILVANHQSMLDGVLITSTLKQEINKKTYLFAKELHWRNAIMKFMARKNNVILMDINNNLREALQKLSYVLQKGNNVIIFPEGTRSKTGLGNFKDTFAILSIELNVPIAPVVITGSDKAVSKRLKIPIPRFFSKVSVDFMAPIYPQSNESYHDLKDRVAKMMTAKIDEIKKK